MTHRERLLGVAGVLGVVGAWWGAAALAGGGGSALPSPPAVVWTLTERWSADDFGGNLLASLGRVMAGFAVGTTLGTAVGVLSGWSTTARWTLYPPLEMARYIPALAWMPLAIMWLGLGELSMIFLVSLGAFFQTLIGMHGAVRRIDPAMFRAARTLGCDGPALLWRVALPAVLGDLATALRVGMTLSYITVVGAELLGADRGLGYLMMLGREDGRTELIVASLALFAVCNLATDAAVRRLFDHLLRWHVGLQGVRV